MIGQGRRPGSGLSAAVRTRRSVFAAFVVAVALAPLLVASPGASAQTEMKVLVTIHKVWERGCYGEKTFLGCIGGEDADFYSVVHIDGERFQSDTRHDQPTIEPGWQFSKAVAPDALSRVTIEMWDEDGGLRGDNDHVDLTAADGHNLELTVVVGRDPGGCRIGGNFPGGTANCGQRLSDGGNNSEESAGIEFTVDVLYPTRVGATTIQCTHAPLWPQPGEAVTVRAVAMEIQTGIQPTAAPGMPPVFGFPHIYRYQPIEVDSLEVWFNADGAAANRTRAADCTGAATAGGCTANVNPTGSSFHYGCWARRGATSVASNFRQVAVGAAGGETIVPVMFNAPRDRAIDIVIHPDQAYANGWTDAQFLTDAATLVNGALAEPVWTQYQGRFNMWIAQRGGNPMWPATGDATTPINFGSIAILADGGGPETFADSTAIIHRRQITDTAGTVSIARDGASGGAFTVNALAAGAANIMRHEIGHAVFGLADEYCCDGGYWQAPVEPNMYTSQANCTADLGALNAIAGELVWPTQGPCRSFQRVTPVPTAPTPAATPQTFWLSDPSNFDGVGANSDLMVGNDYGLAADIRRFRTVFNGLCPMGGC